MGSSGIPTPHFSLVGWDELLRGTYGLHLQGTLQREESKDSYAVKQQEISIAHSGNLLLD